MADTPQAPIASFFYCAAIFLLGETLARGADHFDAVALACVAAAIVAVALPLLVPRLRLSRRLLDALIAVGVIAAFCQLPLIDLFWKFPSSRTLLMPFIVLAVVAAVLCVPILLGRPRSLVGGAFALLLLDFGLMGWFFLNLSASPHIDVYVVQKLGCDALLHGHNPFAMTFPDIYGTGAGFYPDRLVSNGQVHSGYFYPPLSLLLDLPGNLAGDIRFSHLGALLLAAGLIGYGRRQFTLATWLLFSPQIFFILENAWIETYLVMLLALVVWSKDRRVNWVVPLAVGLLLCAKQYVLLTVPAVALLLPTPLDWRGVSRFVLLALAAGSTATLPFIFWNPSAFFHSMTGLYTNMIRSDSISFLPIISRTIGTRLTLLCAGLAAVPPSVLVLSRGQRSGSGFAAAVALICLCVFAFSTQAFINYYFFAIGALLAAIAAERSSPPDPWPNMP